MLNLEDCILDRHGNPLPEIALVGRSNVGKSSLINHLLRLKDLAHVSSVPGKTVTLNYYKIDDHLVIVDLPGYGFAKRSQKDQLQWSENIDHYFNQRTTLKLVLLLVDSRRELSLEDRQIAYWALQHQKPLLLIFTKSDTIKAHEKKAVTEKASILLPSTPSMYYSIQDGKSRDLLIAKINNLLTL